MKHISTRDNENFRTYKFDLGPNRIVALKCGLFDRVMVLNPDRRGAGTLIYREDLTQAENDFIVSSIQKRIQRASKRAKVLAK